MPAFGAVSAPRVAPLTAGLLLQVRAPSVQAFPAIWTAWPVADPADAEVVVRTLNRTGFYLGARDD